MVQLKSDLDVLERCKLDPSIQMPRWTESETVRERMDGTLRNKLLDWGANAARKALIIGATWPRLAIDLAQRDMFVTVVDHDSGAIQSLSKQIADAGLMTKVTVICSDYVQRSFENSAFHLIVAWDSFNRYPEVAPLIKKCTRELKTGGLMFVRAWVSGTQEGVLGRIKKPTAHAIDRQELLDAVDAHLVEKERVSQHYSAPKAANMAMKSGVGSKLLDFALAADARLLTTNPKAGRFLAVMAAKEKHLGKVTLKLR